MIEFNGPITEKNQLDRMKRVDKTTNRSFLIGFVFIWVISLAVGLPLKIFRNFLPELVFFTVIFVGLALIRTPKKVLLRFRLSPHIIITEEDLSLELFNRGKQLWRTRKLSRVKKVLDCGEVYYIIFKFGDITNSWICQKSNIVNGSIEDFEKLFVEKIVRSKEV